MINSLASTMAQVSYIFVMVSVICRMGLAVGPALTAKARLLRELPIGIGMGKVPPPKERERTLINMSLAVRSLDLDFQSGIFRTDGWMSLKWRDPRYTWDPSDYDGIASLPLPFSQTWAPEVILHNSAEERFIYRQVGVVKHDGEFVYVISIHTKSGCQPNYEEYPFGMQLCQLKFGSWVNEQYKVEYRIRPNETVDLEDFSSPTGWKVVATKASLESKQYPLFEEPSHVVVFDLAFVRDHFFDPMTGRVIRRQTPSQSPMDDRGDQREF